MREDERLQLWLPRSLIKPVLYGLHNYSGHLGGLKTKEKSKSKIPLVGIKE